MRWYQKLFWRIFGAVWLVSLVGILASLWLYQSLSGEHERVGFQEERALLYAEQIIDRLETGQKENPRIGRHLPIWIFDEETGRQVYGERRRPPKDALSVEVEDRSGREYEVLFPRAPDVQLLDRMFGFLLSFQVVWLLVVSLLSSLLLTWLIVRPINILRRQVRAVYDDEEWQPQGEDLIIRRTDELGQLAREMAEAGKFVEQTLNAQENLLRDVSHELRAPLARLQASAGLAEQRLGQDDKLVLRINTECERLERLISELLLLSRQQVAQVNQPKVALTELLNELVEDARLVDKDRDIRVELERLRPGLEFAAEPLSRVVSNLLANAIKHSGDGAKIALQAKSSERQLQISVLDTGQGVSPELLVQLGQPFKRASKSSGYGLGLSICKRAVRQMGGELTLENVEDGGFRATLILPIKS